MKITKFTHSCLLVETTKRVGVFDPGSFSWDAGQFKVENLSRLDDIIITHEHADHMHLPFIQKLIAAFPQATIITTAAAADQLRQAGITNVVTASHGEVSLFSADHESTEPLGPTPQNTGVHYMNMLTHPGDCHHFSETKKVLALPITAPWGSIMRAAQLGVELKPQYIIPIHDWHYRPEALFGFYDRLEAFFAQRNITFLKMKDGESHTIDLA